MVIVLSWSGTASAGDVRVGEAAPDFSATDLDGQSRSLSEFEGNFVVLEWFNPDCPFVQKHYRSDNMQGLQRAYTAQDVTWLTVNSSAPGKQGHLGPDEARRVMQKHRAAPTTVLLDPEGRVGRLYGAQTTPHMYVINPDGMLIYKGAIDDTPSADRADVATAKNYVRLALDEAMDGRSVTIPVTKSYGCSVKY